MKVDIIFKYSQDANNQVASCIACVVVLFILSFLLWAATFALTKIKSITEFKDFYTWIPIIAIIVIIGFAIPILNYLIPNAKCEFFRYYYENRGEEIITGELTLSDVSIYETRTKQYFVKLKIGDIDLYPATSFSEKSYERLVKNQGAIVIATITTNDCDIGEPVASHNDKSWNYNCVILKISIIGDNCLENWD